MYYFEFVDVCDRTICRHDATVCQHSINLNRFFQVQATDPDCGVNAMVNYTLAAGRMESEQLMVRSDTGDICVRTPLDRETAPYLEIPVIATDRGTYHSSDHSP